MGFGYEMTNADIHDNCGDPYALNYYAEASSDINCQYATRNINPALLTNLDRKVEESSGLALVNGHLITHNDRGNKNKLYTINPSSGRVTGSIQLNNVQNHDWEDLTQSDEHLYVGDMGNNNGDRKNLAIYKISKSRLQFAGEQTAAVDEIISFEYPNQTDFTKGKDHNFDCEGIIYKDGYLYLFSKNRLDKYSSLYRIPAKEGHHEAELISTFAVGGKITGAAINSNGQVAIIGFRKKHDCFVWLLDEYEENDFFSGRKTQITLGPFRHIGQTEALIYVNDTSLLISSEAVDDIEPRLY